MADVDAAVAPIVADFRECASLRTPERSYLREQDSSRVVTLLAGRVKLTGRVGWGQEGRVG